MPDIIETKVIQVSNVAPSVTKEQLQTLFDYVGKVTDIHLYPDNDFVQVTCKVCYIKFEDAESVGVALHLTSTVFLDRALIVLPVLDGIIPDETTAMRIAVPGNMGAGQLPLNHTWSNLVYNQVVGHVVNTIDPRLIQLSLPQYPPLPASTEPVKLDEIRRTILVSNLDLSVTPEQVMDLFKDAGEVKYLRQLGDDTIPFKTMLVEFTYQASIAPALQLNGTSYMDRPLVVQHSTTAIIKQQQPQSLFPLNMNKSDFDEVLKKVKDTQSLISAAADLDSDKKHRSRSRSGSVRRRSRSRSRSRHSRSRRSRSRRRSGSRTKSRRSRSRSRERSRRVSPPRRRSRSPRRRRSASRSPSRDRKKSRKSRSPSPRREKRKSRSPSRQKKRDRSPSPSKSKRSKEDSRSSRDEKDRRKDRDSESSRKRDKDKEESRRDRRDEKSDRKEDGKDRKKERDRSERDRERSDKDRDRSDKDRERSEKDRDRSEKDRDRSEKDRDRSEKDRDRSDSKRSSDKASKSSKRSPSPRHSRKRSRSRSPKSKSKKDKGKDQEPSKDLRSGEKESNRVARNYDEEEKGFGPSDEDNGQQRRVAEGNESDAGSKHSSPVYREIESISRQSSPEAEKDDDVDMDTDD